MRNLSEQRATRDTCCTVCVHSAWFMKLEGRCCPVRSTREGQRSTGNRRVCRWPSAIKTESSPLRSHVFNNRPRGKLQRWSLQHEIEANSICPLGPAQRIALQGHCNTVECYIPSLSSDGLEWITCEHSVNIFWSLSLPSKQEVTE